MSSLGRLDADHMAALLHFGSFVDKNNRLADLDLHLQFQQPTVRIDNHRLRILVHIFPFPRPGLHDHGNLQHYTLTAPPVCWIGIGHFGSPKVPITITHEVDRALRGHTVSDGLVTIGASPQAAP
jgi:hypothetical protein